MTGKSSASCLIAGGGPAGMVLGYLLARAGIPVTVLEKHRDFLRDFRGDTIHPSTLTVLNELGLLEDFLRQPHQEVRYAEGEIGTHRLRLGDFTHLPAPRPFLVLMPQWDFLSFLAAKARAFPHFRLMMESEAVDVVQENGRVTGLQVRCGDDLQSFHAGLVVGADGRHSILREKSGLKVRDLGAPIDVLWFRLPNQRKDTGVVLGRIDKGRMLVMLYRGDYWQCALVIRKGSFEAVRARGLEQFRREVADLAQQSADAITDWSHVKLLTVRVDRLERWHERGLLFIGDAAHAMSPIGGVGINLAIQDAVATANILAPCLTQGSVTDADLARVEARRRFPTWATQKLQLLIQDNVIDPVLESGKTPPVPWLLRALQHAPWFQRLPARLIGIGFRPEHVHTPDSPYANG
jgi:2-polyprenyl-6-methoxyphenol hydroxylase-like FAD-dependent oxidoreductase